MIIYFLWNTNYYRPTCTSRAIQFGDPLLSYSLHNLECPNGIHCASNLNVLNIVLLVYGPSCWKWWKNRWKGISGTKFWGYVTYIPICLRTKDVHWNHNAPWKQGSWEVTLGAFLDILGAVDSTSLDSITLAANLHELGDTICWWISSMLGGSHNCRRNSGGMSTGRHSITSVVEPGCGWTHKRTQWEWLLYTGVCRWHCYPHL